MHPGARLSKKFPSVEAMKSKTYMPSQESTPRHWESIIADLTAKRRSALSDAALDSETAPEQRVHTGVDHRLTGLRAAMLLPEN
jgi:hypothetical protein